MAVPDGYDALGGPLVRQHALDFGVRPRNDVHGDQLADAPRGGRAGIGRGLDRADVAAREHRDVAGADVLLADEHDVGGFDHRVGGLDGADEAARFDHAECVCCHEVM